jgi:hypothetical protein
MPPADLRLTNIAGEAQGFCYSVMYLPLGGLCLQTNMCEKKNKACSLTWYAHYFGALPLQFFCLGSCIYLVLEGRGMRPTGKSFRVVPCVCTCVGPTPRRI